MYRRFKLAFTDTVVKNNLRNLEEVYIPDVLSFMQFADQKCDEILQTGVKFPNLTVTLKINKTHDAIAHVPPTIYLKDYDYNYQDEK